MSSKRIVIKNGHVCGFADEVSFKGLGVKTLSKQRVSHILPTNRALFILFCAIRTICAEDSKLAEWTRQWGCCWKVVIDGKSYGQFDNRPDAIAFEKDTIYKQGKLSLGGDA